MSFSITSFSFVVFMCVVFIFYNLMPKNKWAVLFVASGIYYAYVAKGNVIPIIVSILSCWGSGIYIAKRKSRVVLFATISLNLGLLLFYKFEPNVLLPLAISFYTLSGVSYIVDTYRGGGAETNPFKLATFMSFFPLMTQGPVVRYKKISKTLYTDDNFNCSNVLIGLREVLWGAFKKLVIADRLYPFVDGIFSNYGKYSGIVVVLAVVAYMIQLYCDFSGGIDICIGFSRTLGVELPQNFRQPYFSASVGEFWRRWHISLGEWFKDYIYVPLAMSKLNNRIYRVIKEKYSTTVAKIVTSCTITFAVWVANGVWHGAGWKYVLFGAYMGTIIAVENYVKIIDKRKIKDNRPTHLFKIIKTLFLIAVGWMMIRTENINAFVSMFISMFRPSKDEILSVIRLYWSDMDCAVLVYAVGALFIGDLLMIKKRKKYQSQRLPFVQLVVWTVLVFSCLVLSYDMGNEVRGFIYARF